MFRTSNILSPTAIPGLHCLAGGQSYQCCTMYCLIRKKKRSLYSFWSVMCVLGLPIVADSAKAASGILL